MFESLSVLILPRLKHFRRSCNSHPTNLTPEEWDAIVDKMIFSFQFIVDRRDDDIGADDKSSAIWNQVEEGLQLFGIYFRHLWI